jgi:hypothetical protein
MKGKRCLIFEDDVIPRNKKKQERGILGGGIVIKKSGGFTAVILLAVLFGRCATVPQEAVELSYVMEENIAALKMSYITLVNAHFDLLEEIRLDYLENDWTPRFVKSWAAKGRLIDIASGRIIWSEERGDFVQPERGLEMPELLTSAVFWANAAVDNIDEKRKELISPLEDQRKELLALVEEGFDRLLRGNMAITAHLSSIRKIKEAQNRAFDTIKLGGLQKEIDKRLYDISKYAAQGPEAVKKADEAMIIIEEQIIKASAVD